MFRSELPQHLGCGQKIANISILNPTFTVLKWIERIFTGWLKEKIWDFGQPARPVLFYQQTDCIILLLLNFSVFSTTQCESHICRVDRAWCQHTEYICMELSSEWFNQSGEAGKHWAVHLTTGFLLPNFLSLCSPFLHTSSLPLAFFTSSLHLSLVCCSVASPLH